jgi:CRP/FNR family transcriptional regulator
MELAQVPLFRELSPEDLEALRREARPLQLDRGEVLFLEGEPVRALYKKRGGVGEL